MIQNVSLAVSVVGLVVSVVNTGLILHVYRHKDGQIAHLLSALLHYRGEPRAAAEAAKAAPGASTTADAPLALLPQQRPRQIGLTQR